MGKKILVTGANGYIGRHVVNELCRRGHNVIAADLPPDDIPANIEKRQKSVLIRSFESLIYGARNAWI